MLTYNREHRIIQSDDIEYRCTVNLVPYVLHGFKSQLVVQIPWIRLSRNPPQVSGDESTTPSVIVLTTIREIPVFESLSRARLHCASLAAHGLRRVLDFHIALGIIIY